MRNIILKYALQNAILHGGTANAGAVVGKVIAEDPELKREMKTVLELAKSVVAEVNALSLDEQTGMLEGIDSSLLEKKKHEEETPKLPELEGVDPETGVVMRMAPFPSGPLHIGNARMVVLNDEYVKKYGGKLILVFDDTIGTDTPSTKGEVVKDILPEAYDLIRDGISWLGIKPQAEYYKSDRIELFYKYARMLIEIDKAYVCTCPAKEFKDKYKVPGFPCPCRSQSVEENIALWEKMLSGGFKPGEAVVRLKTGMDQKNPALRDHPIMKLSQKRHPRVGNNYIVWPLLEFSWAVDDHLLGCTHILRGKDLMKEDLIEEFVWEFLGWPKRHFVHYGKFFLKDEAAGTISKTKSRMAIESGEYSGWDDPRTMSLQSLRRRGFSPQVLRDFLLSFGLSLNDVSVSPELLYSVNRERIDPIAKRRFFVKDPKEFVIDGVNTPAFVKVPVHPDFPNMGYREFAFEKNPVRVLLSADDWKFLEDGKTVRLKDFVNVKLEDSGRLSVVTVEGEGYAADKSLQKIHWLPEGEALKCSVLMPNGTQVFGLGEESLNEARDGEIFQFERFGYVCFDGKSGVDDGVLRFCFTHK